MSHPTHLTRDGSLTMVDVGGKPSTERFAHARAAVRMSPQTEDALRAATLPKGDAFVAAQLGGIMAAKQTATLIPLAHPLPLSSVDVSFEWIGRGVLQIDATAERRQVECLREMKQRRSEAGVAKTLAALKRAAEGKENTMPFILDAVRAYATVGEMCAAFKDVFGVYTETAVL